MEFITLSLDEVTFEMSVEAELKSSQWRERRDSPQAVSW